MNHRKVWSGDVQTACTDQMKTRVTLCSRCSVYRSGVGRREVIARERLEIEGVHTARVEENIDGVIVGEISAGT